MWKSNYESKQPGEQNRQPRERSENFRRASTSRAFDLSNLEAFTSLNLGSSNSINSFDDNLYTATRPENFGGAYGNHNPRSRNFNANQRGGQSNRGAIKRPNQRNLGNSQIFYSSQSSLNLDEAFQDRPPRRNFGQSGQSKNQFETGENSNKTEPNRRHHHNVHRPNQRNLSNSRNFHGSHNSLNLDETVQNRPPRRNFGQHGRNRNQSDMGDNSNETEPNRRRNHNGPHIGFKYLENLVTKCPEELVIEIMKNQDKFTEFVKGNLKPDIIVLLVHVFAQVAHSKFTSNLGHVLINFANEDYMAQLERYIMQLPLQERRDKEWNRYFWEKSDIFWTNLNYLCSKLLDVSPSTAIDILPRLVKSILYTIINLERSSTVTSPEVCSLYETLQIKLIAMTEEKEKKEIRKNRFTVEDDEIPPDDFHDISIYPKPNELVSNTSVFVRRNIIDRKYNDVDHYLDVHFRLLREDFVAPLRKGITEFLNNDGNKRLSNIKVYQNVKFLQMERVQNQMGFLVQVFPIGKQVIRNIETTKRLMFGSLVCFTPDKFKTIYFGKVIDRKKELLVQGQIIVGFELEVLLNPSVEYTMVECLIYFEPYYQVLKALQHVSIEDFPLKKYLVDVEPCVEAPIYIQQNPILKIDHYHLRVTDEYNWPDYEDLGLNQSQFHAFQHALNNTFCIIQGPPGTGKTYLGLRVAKTLLKNKDIWNNLGPMLVICYTNHALDQFLEGLLDTTTDIVRVGGQSRNENLAKYNIKNLRFNSYIRRSSVLRDKECEIQTVGAQLNKWTKRLQGINKCKSVLDFRFFYAIDPQFEESWFYRTSDDEILKWLLEQPGQMRNYKKFEFVAEQADNNEENSDDDIEIDELDATKNHVDIEDDFFKNLGDIAAETELVSLEKVNAKLRHMHAILAEAQNTGMTYEHYKLYEEFEITRKNYEYLQMRLEELQANKLIEEPRLKDLRNPYKMCPDDRWLLYSSWLRRYKDHITQEMNKADIEYRRCYREYDEVREIIDAKLMKEKLVIGMTTTGAARLQTILQVLKCPIVIVEEAAEVLESHIITALTSSCQHLILIGDHKQLRPTTADYYLDKEYNLGISLFERMVKNNLHCSVLNVQHRMRPEIAALISPNIYSELHNHDSVCLYKKVMGIEKSLFFITHNNREKESNDNSKENNFEAVYLIKLAKYLVLNGHEPEKITVIAAYSGQLFRLLKERRKYFNLKDLKITVLDNYQGEENDIILLSLVRNNENNKIGFLYLENRVCVALSRAKHGMYVMGNIDMLCSNSKIWPKIRNVLENNNSLGKSLTLRCQKHVDTVTEIEKIEDFEKVPEGGCMKMCNTKLPCEHICPKLCHMIPHDQYKCEQPCLKTLCDFNHPCPSMCYEDCENCMVPKKANLSCGHELHIPCFMEPNEVLCPIKVPVTLPCGHKTDKSCHMDINKVRCTDSCDTRIEPCGHSCMMKCHIKDDPDHLKYKCYKNCERSKKYCTSEDQTHKCEKYCYEECDPCNIKVKKARLNCAHVENIECWKDVNEMDCKKPCKRIMICGHPCKQKCFEPCGGCTVKVNKIIDSCGHTIKIECSKIPDIKMCKGNCTKTLVCGHKCNLKCKDDCKSAKCKELVTKNNKADCGHYLRVPCYLANELEVTNTAMSYCPEKCNTLLVCGHTCSGTCGECAQGRMHKMCQEKCNRILVCGHECSIPCRAMCQPCELPCSYKCIHSKCKQKCGVPCTNCVEPCARRCKHQRCSKRCYEKCDVEPCQEPCDKILECSHPCIGFCGEPCPPLCLVCNEEEVTEIFFGTEEEDSRYVYLEECKHLLESSGLDHWFNQANEKSETSEISFKHCPKCKTKINSTQRYSESIKAAIKDVQVVKKRFFGSAKQNANKKEGILLKMNLLENNFQINGCPGVNVISEYYVNLKKEKKHHQQLLSSYTSKLEILEVILNAYIKHKITKPESKKMVEEHINYLVKFLNDKEGCISDQRIEDFKMELNRLTRVMELAKIMNDSACHFPSLYIYKECCDAIFKFSKYDNHQDAILIQKMKILSEKAKSALPISDQERREILKAMNFTQGHWFKCPNGHIYAIGECGGAMQESKCPECKANIGGRNHALTAGNSVATEMDGARYGAFSNLANLANYDMRHII